MDLIFERAASVMSVKEKEAFMNGKGRFFNFRARTGILLPERKIVLCFPKISPDGRAYDKETDQVMTECFCAYLEYCDV